MNWPTGDRIPDRCNAFSGRAGMLYAATERGLFRSRAGSGSWQLESVLGEKPVRRLLLDKRDRLFATLSSENGCFLSFVSNKEGEAGIKLHFLPALPVEKVIAWSACIMTFFLLPVTVTW